MKPLHMKCLDDELLYSMQYYMHRYETAIRMMKEAMMPKSVISVEFALRYAGVDVQSIKEKWADDWKTGKARERNRKMLSD